VALPWLNGLLDWISLSASRWFGRAIVAERDSPASLAITSGLALADLILAVAFAFAVAWVLAFGVEAAGLAFGLPLELDAYVRAAADAPWSTGFWATFMVLSTLLPSAIHLVLALGAVLVAWSAIRSASGRQAGSRAPTSPTGSARSSTSRSAGWCRRWRRRSSCWG
jgi:hypothetical protein